MCKGPECLYLGETFHINTVSNPRKPRPLANHTSGFLALPWSPGLGRACGPTQPALPSSFHPNSATPCTPKGVPLYYHPAPQLRLTLPASSSPPSPSQAQEPPSACSQHVPGVGKRWGTFPWDPRVSLFHGLCSLSR